MTSSSSSGWTENILYGFTFGTDGGYPLGGVIFDHSGNLYGTTLSGGTYWNCYGLSCGTIFELTPSPSGWSQHTLYAFQGGQDGGLPIGGVVFGQDGYLYGTTTWGGLRGGGTAFSLNHPWVDPYPLSGSGDYYLGPWSSLTMDAAGDFYGTTYADGAHGQGTVFKIAISCGCGGCGWVYRDLHDFAGGTDGANPVSSIVLDADGSLYGTTSAGGAYGQGVVFQITPQDSQSEVAETCSESK